MADTGHTPGQFEVTAKNAYGLDITMDEWPDDWHNAVPGRAYVDGNDVYDAWEPAPGKVELNHLANCRDGGIAREVASDWNAAPSLLARAEAADERVRVLEGQNADMREAALRLVEEAIHIGRHIPVSGQGEYDKLIAAVYAVRSLAALATTGVQHG